jgi:hypothetical protein
MVIQEAAVPSHDQHASEHSAAPHSGQTANKLILRICSPIHISSTQLHMQSSCLMGAIYRTMAPASVMAITKWSI